MNTEYEFKPDYKVIGNLRNWDQETIRKEPMLFRADREFARKYGGVITNEFVDVFLQGDDPVVIDSKVVMLMPGMWPCIPGWHHDSIPRDGPLNQPNYEKVGPDKEVDPIHTMVWFGETAPTEFVDEGLVIGPVKEGKIIYQAWDQMLRAIEPKTKLISAGEVVKFHWQAFHRGTQATKMSWRFFIRATYKGEGRPANQIRHQVQVYMQNPYRGW